MNNQKLDELRLLYENGLKDKAKSNYTPFALKISDAFDGKNSVLFVGKAENMEKCDNATIEDAFNKIFSKTGKGMNTITEKPNGKAARSAYSRVMYKLSKCLQETKGINSFARTNLYKLSTTKSDVFGSKYETVFVDIFKKEIELLQPKYVILLTGGLEDVFLQHLGEGKIVGKLPFSYKNKGKIQDKKCYCKRIDGIDSLFIAAFHPQGKPEKELVKVIISLINDTEKL